MAFRAQVAKAAAAVERHGALLVYPEAGRAQPLSLWHALYPKSAMEWRWDSDADPRVGEVWRVREALCHSRALVYSKWYHGRAAFFAPELFEAMLRLRRGAAPALTVEARDILAALRDDSPQSTKQLRRAAGLSGRAGESLWTRALKELWQALRIVGTGEVPDGAFPSLALASTDTWFEPLWDAAASAPSSADHALIARHFPDKSPWARAWARLPSSAPDRTSPPR